MFMAAAGNLYDIVFADGRLAYRYLPKTASTSIKAAIYKIETGEDFFHKEAGMHIHDWFKGRPKADVSSCERRFILVRDPVRRFLSAYKNRVRFHGELSEPLIRQRFPHLYRDTPHFTPGIGQFIEHLDHYLKFPSIFHHCRPVSDFLDGRGLTPFTDVYRFDELGRLEEDLSKWTEQDVHFEHRQKGGTAYNVSDLTRAQMERLIDYYRRDYDLLSEHYPAEAIWKTWQGVDHDPSVGRGSLDPGNAWRRVKWKMAGILRSRQ